jgi:hypothetical protein
MANNHPLVSDAARIARYTVTAIGGYMVGRGYLHADTVEAAATLAATVAPVVIGIVIGRCKKSAGGNASRGVAKVLGFRSPLPKTSGLPSPDYTYSQATGEFARFGKKPMATGYSGRGKGKNNPAMETVRATGPIPAGRWRIGESYASARTGPVTIPLYSQDEKPRDDIDQRTRRSAFRIHGDSIKAPGTASSGCIILPRAIRLEIAQEPGAILLVTE